MKVDACAGFLRDTYMLAYRVTALNAISPMFSKI